MPSASLDASARIRTTVAVVRDAARASASEAVEVPRGLFEREGTAFA
jgi:hypothetical protein